VSPRLPLFDCSTDKMIVHCARIPVAPRALVASAVLRCATHFQLQFGIELSPLKVS
jgi:hypothetical protein